jgi:oligopeptide/dipeptide ABC transporter ATP-binding protein
MISIATPSRVRAASVGAMDERDVVLKVEGLEVHYRPRHGRGRVVAVDGVDLHVARGETLGLVGESGCGKSTLGRVIVGLERSTRGAVYVEGQPLPLDGSLAGARRLDLQMIFQDPYSALNPRRRLGDAVAQAVRARDGSPSEERVRELFEQVGLDQGLRDRFPHEASGGQLQRVVIARVLATRPKIVVADEPVSALDVSVQAQILNLFADLCDQLHLTTIFISHDLGVVRHVSDRTAVMYLGRIVETAPTEQLVAAPRHPYTQALIAALPAARGERVLLPGDPPDPTAPPSGCRFRTRCARATSVCAEVEPELTSVDGETGAFACHHPLDIRDRAPASVSAPST